MNKKVTFIVLTAILQICFKTVLAQPCKEVIGYYPNWQWYDRAHLVNPKSIDYSKYTVINYSFFKPSPSGIISQTDSWADENLLKGDPDWNLGGYKPNTSIIDLAHKNGVKVMVAVGGWTLSDDFPALAASAPTRQKFAEECIRLIKEYNFDGIDIDWEYPGYADHKGTPADKHNFTLLLQAIRNSLTAHGLTTGKTYLLSACFSADPARAADIEWDKIIVSLDMINLMTYDFFGSWEAKSNHNSPLYAPAEGEPSFNSNSAFNMLTTKYKVPSTKINMGVAFYGRSFANCKGIFQTHSGTDTNMYPEDEGTPLYYNIVKKFSSFTRYWDNQAKVPYAIGGANSTLLSYDDEESIGLKADFVVRNNARGCIIWEITGDYIEGASGQPATTPLANKIKQVFCNIPTSISSTNTNEIKFSIHPNPVADELFIEAEGAATVRIVNLSGQLVFEKNMDSNIQVDFQNMAKGTYICILKNKDNNVIGKKMFVH